MPEVKGTKISQGEEGRGGLGYIGFVIGVGRKWKRGKGKKRVNGEDSDQECCGICFIEGFQEKTQIDILSGIIWK